MKNNELQNAVENARSMVAGYAAKPQGADDIKNIEAYKQAQESGDVKDDRFNRRLKKRKGQEMDALVAKFLQDRGQLDKLGTEEEGEIYDKYYRQWAQICATFNKKNNAPLKHATKEQIEGLKDDKGKMLKAPTVFPRHPFTLRVEAFAEQVEYYLDMEKREIEKAREHYKQTQFENWLKRKKGFMFKVVNALFWVITFGKPKKVWLKIYTKKVYTEPKWD